MSMKHTCDCGQSIPYTEKNQGRRIRCPGCQKEIRLPGEKISASGSEETESVSKAPAKAPSVSSKNKADLSVPTKSSAPSNPGSKSPTKTAAPTSSASKSPKLEEKPKPEEKEASVGETKEGKVKFPKKAPTTKKKEAGSAPEKPKEGTKAAALADAISKHKKKKHKFKMNKKALSVSIVFLVVIVAMLMFVLRPQEEPPKKDDKPPELKDISSDIFKDVKK